MITPIELNNWGDKQRKSTGEFFVDRKSLILIVWKISSRFDQEPAWLNRLEKRGKSFINVFSISYVYVHCTCYCSVSAFNHIANENFNVTRLRSCHILKLQGKPHQRREGDIDTATGHHWAAGGNVLRFIQLANHLISLPPSLSACHSVSQGRRKKTVFFTFSKKNWDPPSPFFDHLFGETWSKNYQFFFI